LHKELCRHRTYGRISLRQIQKDRNNFSTAELSARGDQVGLRVASRDLQTNRLNTKEKQTLSAAELKMIASRNATYSTICFNYFLIILISGILVRLFLLNYSNGSGSICEWLRNRIEVSTPLTSWQRVLEGIYLKDNVGISSYEGDLVHELPIMLHFYKSVIAILGENRVPYFFVLVDVISCLFVFKIAYRIITHMQLVESANLKRGAYVRLLTSHVSSGAMSAEPESPETPDKQKEIENDTIKAKLDRFFINEKNFNVNYWSLFAASVYFLNPFCLSSCLAQSTVVIQNFIILLWLLFLINGNRLLSLICLALHSNITVYSVSLLPATITMFIQQAEYASACEQTNENESDTRDKQAESNQENKQKAYSSKNNLNTNWFITSTIIYFALVTALIFGLNYYLEGFNSRFAESTYFFILKVPDLQPNLGLFWYFFTEMFEHFRLFFTYVFQLNAFIYAIPLAIRLRDEPIVNIFVQMGFSSILKSYPSIGETGLYLSLLPTVAFLFPLMRNFLVYSVMLITSTVLSPVMLYLWLGSGGGNANFYFAITLVYSIGQIFLLVDVLYAYLKREFIKRNGMHVPKDSSNKAALFLLE
jgi:GPI-anchor transamidase subunit U